MNLPNIIANTQAAVEAAQTSKHPDSKVGACVAAPDNLWHFAHPNFWPPAIEKNIGRNPKIGNASGTLHAETAALLLCGHATKGAAIFSTDPSCPNCAKNMAEAGIAHLYIDHKGFEKYYAQTRMADFETLTIEICAAAGIGISRVFRKEQRIEEILSPGKADNAENPVLHFAACLTEGGAEIKIYGAASPGLTTPDPHKESKYDLLMQPLNRLLMTLAREGLTADPQSFITSRTPTSRELVNFIGAGYTALTILDKKSARDDDARAALELLQKNQILNIQ